VNEIFAEKG